MDITTEKQSTHLLIRLRGRLDSTWCPAVQESLTAAIKAGEHALQLDMREVDYISSTGLRVLLATYKQLRAVKGRFAIGPASPAVASVLELAGLDMLLDQGATPAAAPASGFSSQVSAFSSSALTGEVHTLPPPIGRSSLDIGHSSLRVRPVGDPAALRAAVGAIETLDFPAGTFGLGIGALGTNGADCTGRHGEFVAAGGCAAYQPTDGASRPDFLVTSGALIPRARIVTGLRGEGDFTHLLRFEARPDQRTVPLSDLAAACIQISTTTGAAAFVAVTETSGLVGATLRQDPARAPANRFDFPQIRDWLSFTGERSFRDTTSLIVGVVARPDYTGPLADQLRPLGAAPGSPLGHIHAAAFPYRPLQKGLIDLAPTVASLFDGPTLQSVLHLLTDTRGLQGVGESEFHRGALWLAPIAPLRGAVEVRS